MLEALRSYTSLGGDLSENHDHTSLGGSLASNLGGRVLSQAGIEDSVGNLIATISISMNPGCQES